MCGTDSVSRPFIIVGFITNLRTGRGKSALGPQNLGLRDHSRQNLGTLSAGSH